MTTTESSPNKLPEKTLRLGADTPVIVLGGGLTGIGVLHSLWRDHIPVYSACGPYDLPAKSRWYRKPPQNWDCSPSPDTLAEYLASLKLAEAVLIGCSDDWTKAVAALPPLLRDRFPASVSPPSVVETLVDKWQFAQLAERLDVPRPRTVLVQSLPEMAGLDDSYFEGMFLKPLDSQKFALQTSVKAFALKSKAQALAIMLRMETAEDGGFPILLQEYVPGPATSYFLVDGFVDRRRSIRALIARRRLRMNPPMFGNSTLSETIPLEKAAAAVTAVETLMSALQFRGIFDAEFKFDERDGQFKVIEINPRPWWFVQFATRCGVDLCGMSYRDALGLDVELNQGYAVGRRCMSLTADFAANWAADPGIPGILRWVRSLRGVDEILFQKDDPRPLIASTLGACRNHLRSRLRRTNAA
jgi:predicted ATP-grasp superfamily ATP-dependent carboligase